MSAFSECFLFLFILIFYIKGIHIILAVDISTSIERKCNMHIYEIALQPIYCRDIILKSLVLVHAGYLFCNLNTNYCKTNFGKMPGCFNFSPINVWVVGRGVLALLFIVSLKDEGCTNCCPREDTNRAPPRSYMPDKC